MSHIGDDDFSLGIKKLVVLIIGSHEHICTRTDGLAEKEPPSTAANSHIGNRLLPERRMPDYLGPKPRFEQPKEITFLYGLFQPAHQAAAHILMVVLQPVDIVRHLLIGVCFEKPL